MKILIHWLISALAIVIAAYIIPGVTLSGFSAALIVALVLGILNAILRPILIVLTLPINILTLGLFTLVINTAIIMLVDRLVGGFSVASFLSALLFGVVLAVVNAILHSLDRPH